MHIHRIKSRSASSGTVNGNTSIPGEKLVSRRKAITLGRYRNCYKENYRRMTLMDTSRPRPPASCFAHVTPPLGGRNPFYLLPRLDSTLFTLGDSLACTLSSVIRGVEYVMTEGRGVSSPSSSTSSTPRRSTFNREEATTNATVGGLRGLQQPAKFQASESRRFRVDASRQIIGHRPSVDSTRDARTSSRGESGLGDGTGTRRRISPVISAAKPRAHATT